MNKTIWKFPIAVRDKVTMTMPEGAEIIHVAMQGEQPTMWAIVDPSAMQISRHFYIFGTGNQIQSPSKHVGTFFMLDGTLVWHVFEKLDEPARKAKR